MKQNSCIFAILLWILSSGSAAFAQQDFGGSYSGLLPEQKRVVDDWFQRFSAVIKKTVNPAEGYDKMPLSYRTTFSAVTHALLRTKLTDDSDKPLADSAFGLVGKVDRLVGQVPGARGDQQFRIYVQVKPGAMDLLEKSKEFRRAAENTVYHRGYPICFRSMAGTPSIQVSLTGDATRADIDVDYRSSTFPVFLVNGHLASSNSDVRAGDNDERHNKQWAGLQNWWRNLLGLPVLENPQSTSGQRGAAFAPDPKMKDVKQADAIRFFLHTWLVEQTPGESIPYVSEDAFACMELEGSADRGMAKVKMLLAMNQLNGRIGKVSTLDDASTAVRLTSERVKWTSHPNESAFALYDVREDLATEFDCVNKLDPARVSQKALKSKAFGKFVGAVFRLNEKGKAGEAVATLWQRESGYWKMISYRVEPELDQSRIPQVATVPDSTPALPQVAGDKDMIRAASDFLKQWLVQANIDKALEYIAPECLGCVGLDSDDSPPAPSSPAEARELLKKSMAKAAEQIGARKGIETGIVAPEPHHQDLKLVRHPGSKAFAIVSIPDYMGEGAACERRKLGEGRKLDRSATGHGKYYALGFSRQGSDHPSVLWIVWGKSNGSWKALSYALLTS